MKYNVAIIIPTLNEEHFISKCLDSIITQSYPFEKMNVMIVDGGSCDRTHEIVENYHKKYCNILFLNNPGKIQSIAFNIGIKESIEPYIIRLDAHAIYDSNYIELCLQDLDDDPNRGNVGGICKILPYNNTVWAETNAILNYSKFGIGGASFRVGTKAGKVDTVPFGAFRRSIIEKIGGMREDLPRGEDNEFNSRIRKAGYDIYFNPQIISTYFARPSLKSSAKQMYANGLSIGILYYIDKSAVSLRHIVPLAFVLGIILGAMLSIFLHPILYVYIAGLGLYFICDFIASLISAKKHGWKYLFPLFISFFVVHISYGLGTIKGLIKRKY